MKDKWTIKCSQCGKAGSFEDAKDVTQSRWKIIAWNVKNGEPICRCYECEKKNDKD